MQTPPRSSSWVIGRGLLGRAVAVELDGEPFASPVDWSDQTVSLRDLAEGFARFLAQSPGEWQIFWCAGAGVTATDRSIVEREVAVFEAFCEAIADAGSEVTSRGRVFLASSVGGAYAGNPHPPFTETSPTAPLSPYGEAKLRMEAALTTATERSNLRSFIARITNLYGPGQDLSKGQGLISTIARTYFTGEAASIFVSLDTIRDYVYVVDCAKVIVNGMHKLDSVAAGSTVVKIVGAANAVSIGALIGEFGRLRRSRPLIVLGAGNARGQAPDLRVRSEVWTDLDAYVSTTLPAGIAATYQSLAMASMASR